MAANPEGKDDYATKGDLEDLRAAINRDVRHALDEALGQQSADLNRRIDRLEAKMNARFDALLERLARP